MRERAHEAVRRLVDERDQDELLRTLDDRLAVIRERDGEQAAEDYALRFSRSLVLEHVEEVLEDLVLAF